MIRCCRFLLLVGLLLGAAAALAADEAATLSLPQAFTAQSSKLDARLVGAARAVGERVAHLADPQAAAADAGAAARWRRAAEEADRALADFVAAVTPICGDYDALLQQTELGAAERAQATAAWERRRARILHAAFDVVAAGRAFAADLSALADYAQLNARRAANAAPGAEVPKDLVYADAQAGAARRRLIAATRVLDETVAPAAAPAGAGGPGAAPLALTPARVPAGVHLGEICETYYPASSRRLNEQGSVVLLVYVGPSGSVLRTTVETPSGYERLDAAAQRCIEERGVFEPQRIGGEAVGSWQRMKWTWRLEANQPSPEGMVAEAAPAAAGQTPHVTGAALTSQAIVAAGKRTAVRTFGADDYVVTLVDFAWPEVGTGAGVHRVTWRWFRDGTLVSESEQSLNFTSTPYTTSSKRAASTLGAGHCTVTTFLDGTAVSSSDFDVTG